MCSHWKIIVRRNKSTFRYLWRCRRLVLMSLHRILQIISCTIVFRFWISVRLCGQAWKIVLVYTFLRSISVYHHIILIWKFFFPNNCCSSWMTFMKVILSHFKKFPIMETIESRNLWFFFFLWVFFFYFHTATQVFLFK